MGISTPSLVWIVSALVVPIATLALAWISQHGTARKNYVEMIEKAMDARLQNCEASKAEVIRQLADAMNQVAVARNETVNLRSENIELMRRLVLLERRAP